MKKSEKKIIIFELIIILFLILNVFVKNIFVGNNVIFPVGILLFLSILLFGFEKVKMINKDKKKIITIIIFYTVAFLIIIYGFGLLTSYVKSPYSLTLKNIIKNTFPVIFLLALLELFRYNICRKSNKNKKIYFMTLIIFTILDFLIALPFYNIKDYEEILKMLTLVILPSITKNIMLIDFSYKYGYLPTIIYQLIMNLYLYLLPIYPNLSIYLESVIMFLLPLIIKYVIDNTLTKEKKVTIERKKTKNIFSNICIGICILLIVVIVTLYSNIFSYWIAVVGSGSMSPTIQVGDAIIVDKTIKNNLENLKVGDILVFRIKDSIYTHRIVDIKEENSTYLISTKGDREGQVIDNWTVKNDDIVGVVRFKVSYIGYPTVLLNRFIKENKK